MYSTSQTVDQDVSFESELTAGDWILLVFVTISFFVFIIPLYYRFLKLNPLCSLIATPHESTPLVSIDNPNYDQQDATATISLASSGHESPQSNNNNNNNRQLESSDDNKQYELYCAKLSLISVTLFVIRELFGMLLFVTWTMTLNYTPLTSISSNCDAAREIFNQLATWTLYLYFIVTLYQSYSGNCAACIVAEYSNKVYIGLGLIHLCLLCFMVITVYGWITFDPTIYTISQFSALLCEFILSILIGVLYFKPLIKLNGKWQSISQNIHNDKLTVINLSTRVFILSGVSLGSTALIRIITVALYTYCANAEYNGKCWFEFIAYALWPIDAFINIFCLFCAFTFGTIYYRKVCSKLHNWILMHCMTLYLEKKVAL